MSCKPIALLFIYVLPKTVHEKGWGWVCWSVTPKQHAHAHTQLHCAAALLQSETWTNASDSQVDILVCWNFSNSTWHSVYQRVCTWHSVYQRVCSKVVPLLRWLFPRSYGWRPDLQLQEMPQETQQLCMGESLGTQTLKFLYYQLLLAVKNGRLPHSWCVHFLASHIPLCRSHLVLVSKCTFQCASVYLSVRLPVCLRLCVYVCMWKAAFSLTGVADIFCDEDGNREFGRHKTCPACKAANVLWDMYS